MNLSGKVALITGASRGIGKAIAIELAKAGATIIINYNKSYLEADKTLEAIKNLGGFGKVLKADVSSYEEAKKLTEDTLKAFGKIDFLINNAGISSVGLFMDMKKEQWEELIDTNIKGVINTTHSVLETMIKRKNGVIVNISSIWGESGASCEVVYSATKGAVNSFTKALAKELGPSNIRVNAVAPGVIDTEMNGNLSKEEKMCLAEEIPLMRFGKASEVAKLVVYLCSEDSRYITGQVITIDGGFV